MSKKQEKTEATPEQNISDKKTENRGKQQEIVQPKMSPKMGTSINMQPLTVTREETPREIKNEVPSKEILYNGEKPKWKGKMDMSSAAMYDAPRNIQ